MSPLEQIMGTEEAARLWGLHQDYVKELCQKQRIKAIRIGKTWIIDRNVANPKVTK